MQQNALLLSSFYSEKANLIDKIKSEITNAAFLVSPSPEPGFTNVNEFYNVYKDSAEVYRKRGIEVLNHILKEIPETVMPMRREFKVEYGLALLNLGDDANAKKILDDCIKVNMQYYKFFKSQSDKSGESEMFAGREMYVSEESIKRVINTVESKGKMAWGKEYREKTREFIKL
jgi:hypothetical protein